jgi:hypothetical protein
MNETFGEFNISYDNATKTWTLGKVSKGFFSNLFGSKPSVLFSKTGDNATNRFLTTQCTELGEGIYQHLEDANITFVNIKQNKNLLKSIDRTYF